ALDPQRFFGRALGHEGQRIADAGEPVHGGALNRNRANDSPLRLAGGSETWCREAASGRSGVRLAARSHPPTPSREREGDQPAVRIAPDSAEVSSRRCSGASLPCVPMSSPRAEPTITPSATRAIAAACSGVRTPKPTATGKSVAALNRFTASSMLACAACCLPVIPATET